MSPGLRNSPYMAYHVPGTVGTSTGLPVSQASLKVPGDFLVVGHRFGSWKRMSQNLKGSFFTYTWYASVPGMTVVRQFLEGTWDFVTSLNSYPFAFSRGKS